MKGRLLTKKERSEIWIKETIARHKNPLRLKRLDKTNYQRKLEWLQNKSLASWNRP